MHNANLAALVTPISVPFVDELVRRFPGPITTAAEAPSALDVYTRALSAAADRSVTIVSIGFATNLMALLSSELGAELVARKVERRVVMGGWYPRSPTPREAAEWNFGACGPTNVCVDFNNLTEPPSRHYDELGPISHAVYTKLWPRSVPITFSAARWGRKL